MKQKHFHSFNPALRIEHWTSRDKERLPFNWRTTELGLITLGAKLYLPKKQWVNFHLCLFVDAVMIVITLIKGVSGANYVKATLFSTADWGVSPQFFIFSFFTFGHSGVSSPVTPVDQLVPSQSPSLAPCFFPFLNLPKECSHNETFVFVQWAGVGSKWNWMFSPHLLSSYYQYSLRTLSLGYYLEHPLSESSLLCMSMRTVLLWQHAAVPGTSNRSYICILCMVYI